MTEGGARGCLGDLIQGDMFVCELTERGVCLGGDCGRCFIR